jgi:hypothetical protein
MSRLMLCFLFGIFVIITTGTTLMITLGRSTAPHSDPFSTYADIMPGQPFSQAEKYGFECAEAVNLELICSFKPQSGLFNLILLAGQANIIHSAEFGIRDGGLFVGDLTALWGQPQIEVGAARMLRWGLRYAPVSTRYHTITPLTPIDTVIFTDQYSPLKAGDY